MGSAVRPAGLAALALLAVLVSARAWGASAIGAYPPSPGSPSPGPAIGAYPARPDQGPGPLGPPASGETKPASTGAAAAYCRRHPVPCRQGPPSAAALAADHEQQLIDRQKAGQQIEEVRRARQASGGQKKGGAGR